MSKLFKLKQWLTIPDAAKHLSLVFDEEVTQADVLRLALDGHLSLSVRLVNHVIAYGTTIVPVDQAPADDQVEGVYFTYDNKVLTLQDSPTTLTGVYDLPLWGTERFDVESRYQTLTNGPPVELTCVEGTFVMGPDGTLFQLQWVDESGDHHPAGRLPEDAALVVRTDALRAFEESIAGEQGIDRPLRTRERRTLLTIIAGLCDMAKIKRGGYGEAKQIASATERLGAPVSADKISLVFVEIDEAVEARKKN